MKKILISIIGTILFALVAFYIILPPINLSSIVFYFYMFLVASIFLLLISIPSRKKGVHPFTFKFLIIYAIGSISVVSLIIVTNIILSPIFNSKSYANRISVNENNTFEENIKEVDFNKIPLLDKDSSEKLGDRVMGQLSDLVSQFYVSDMYTQINYNDAIIRVTPLEYNGLIKYFTNRSKGIPGYITVDSVNGEAKLVKLDKGMKYVPSAYFFENLQRKLRFSYPTSIFGEINFEVDNEGNPYFIAPVIKYSGVGLKRDVKAVVIINAITGQHQKYSVNETPTWVDHVYSASMIIEQLDDWGSFRNGYLNSLFGQKNVVATTDGYNYLTMDDDVYLYTGITSVLADESNIGFILTNMRTKETNFYAVPGAEEYSAMASAEGQVQQMSYTSTFPLLINLNHRPTYLISLKDDAGLVKMYAFVDVADYQKVVVTDASKGINEAARNYLNAISSSYSGTNEKNITISMITSSIINGNTYYYIIDTDNQKYRVSINVDEYNIPFYNVGTQISIIYRDGDVKEITNIKK